VAIRLESGLPHQKKAIEAINEVFKDVRLTQSSFAFINPEIDLKSGKLKENIANLQRSIHPSMRGSTEIGEYLNIDIKMETGTGKTYVYTNTIFELHKNYGINKFIILVPTLPIKAGTKQFIESDYVKRHFREDCGYHSEIELYTLEAKATKKSKETYPSSVRHFICGSNLISNRIQVLLVNMQMFQDKKGGVLTQEYGYAAEGYYKPSEGIKATKPVIIIDEPHRFSKENKTFEFINHQIKPQCIIRFGATYPEIERKENNKKVKEKDYHNLVYNLGSCDAFNQNLIKGVRKEHLPSPTGENVKVKLLSTESKSKAKFQFITENEKKTEELSKGESLSMLHPAFEGVHIEAIGKTVELSNGQVLEVGKEIYTDIYSYSYQELMIKLALKRHFETERENFRRKFKIKTLSLFFIDDIDSYRFDAAKGNETYLKNAFEKELLERINAEISEIDELIKSGEDFTLYRDYLETSKRNLSATHSGYFARDNNDSEEEIAKEINEILFEKEKLLSIKNLDGSFNTRRFIFSKWTLKEGWDNPNVFTIAKLRSSGSEISKLQEVGRGLRLPVDENGNRISDEEFYLNYIVDFTEKDFAGKLVAEINGDTPEINRISRENLEKLAQRLNIKYDMLKATLMVKEYIDDELAINEEKREELFAEYPDLSIGLKSDKVTDRNKKEPQKVKIRGERYNELKGIWEKLNKKYFLVYEKLQDEYLLQELVKILEEGVYSEDVVTSRRDRIEFTESGLATVREEGLSFAIAKFIPYNKFLKNISEAVNIPINILHTAFVEYSKKTNIPKDFFNEYTAGKLIIKFEEWKKINLTGRFNYKKADLLLHPTALTRKDGSVKDVITQGLLGTKILQGEAQKKYLYDIKAFDSDLEKENILSEIEEVIVFGKIPKNSIRIPIIGGGTYSPDFLYVVKKSNGSKELNIVIETKDVESDSNLREDEQMKIKCAEVFFEQLKIDGMDVKFRKQLKGNQVKGIIDEVLG
jgi:type III restriction enzyme